ncbi:MAG: DNA-binding response regulator, partial [Rhodospirillales bacterium]|nr:DNA-binding response regulator [Rhodospirillales bacterium]
MQPSAASIKFSDDARGTTNAASPDTMRVVVVDDDDLFRESLRLNLVDQNFD